MANFNSSKVFYLEDINENVPSYGLYPKWFKQVQLKC